MSEQLWTDEELKVAAFNLATTYLMDKSAGKATPLSQLIHVHLVEMRDKCATALDAANATIAELQDALDGMRGIAQQRMDRVRELERELAKCGIIQE